MGEDELRRRRAERDKRWTEANREHLNAKRRKKRAENPERFKLARARRHANPLQNIANRMRCRIKNVIRTRDLPDEARKNGRQWEQLVGYTCAALISHIESLFLPGMSWENFGDWQIDHLVPVASYRFASVDDPEFRQCWALLNLRPIWAEANRRKAAKLPDFDSSRWPADQIERWPLDRLVPYARNARRHGPSQVAEIAASIREWGWTVPALVDDTGRIIAGHGRVLAAEMLGIDEIPVVVARGWSEAQKRAYTLADNELPMHATWNKELLKIELSDLHAQGFDLTTMGFSPEDVLSTEDVSDRDVPQALQLEPAREYAVVMCATLDEWERLKVALNLTPARRGGYKRGSPLDDIATQRVIHARDLLPRLEADARRRSK